MLPRAEFWFSNRILKLHGVGSRCALITVIFPLLLGSALGREFGQAQTAESRTLEIPAEQVAAHRLGKIDPIRVRLTGLPLQEQSRIPIPFTVIVAPDGSVISAQLEGELDPGEPDTPKTLFTALKDAVARARAEVLALRYEPFVRDGNPVTATFEEKVLLVPADEKPVRHVDFPQIKNWKSLRMTLRRTGCFGTCPAYSIEIHGDGTVLYDGQGSVAVTGKHSGFISQKAVAAILDAFRRADYFSLQDKYMFGATDLPTYTTSIEFDGRSKKVEDYAGLEVGMPAAVDGLEKAIDALADSARWTKGDAGTFSALAAEKWNFKSSEAADTLARIALYGSADAVRDLVAAGVPLSGHDYMRSSPLEIAAFRGDMGMMNAILQGSPGTDPTALSSALSRAAAAGKLDAVELLLRSGANADAHLSSNEPPVMEPPLVAAAAAGVPAIVTVILERRPDISARGYEGRTALIAAVETAGVENNQVNRLEVVRLLLAAGADVDARDDKGNTALIKNARDPAIALLLIRHGADVKASNDDGWTPLFSASTPELARTLLQNGADMYVRNKDGKTPLETAKQFNNPEVAAILEAAQAGKLK